MRDVLLEEFRPFGASWCETTLLEEFRFDRGPLRCLQGDFLWCFFGLVWFFGLWFLALWWCFGLVWVFWFWFGFLDFGFAGAVFY